MLRFFSQETINYFVWPLIQIGLVVTLVAGWVAYATYLERKISAFIQARLGPMRVGPWGLLQPIADGLKLLVKEDFIPENADRWIFFFAPYIAVASAFIVFSVVPFGPDWAVIADVNIGLLLVLAVSSVGVLALILAGWSSNSKYALLGGLRSSAQMVSYEVAMGLSLIGALMFARTLSLSGIVGAQGVGFDLVRRCISRPDFCCSWSVASPKTIARRLICRKRNQNSSLVSTPNTPACAGRSFSWLSTRRWSSSRQSR